MRYDLLPCSGYALVVTCSGHVELFGLLSNNDLQYTDAVGPAKSCDSRLNHRVCHSLTGLPTRATLGVNIA